MQTELPRIAVVGAGYWGENLVRNFHALGALECVCDVREQALAKMHSTYGVKTALDVAEVLNNEAIRGVVIAAPAVQHYDLAKMALLHDKDVFVEKPLSLRSSEADELVKLALKRGRILMVGHILEYHPAITTLKKLIREGQLGKIQYIYSSRLNLGKLRTEENILWSFAPHDISAILSLLGEVPVHASAHGGKYLNSHIYDTTLSTLDFKSGVAAHIFVSWLHPFKEQKLMIVADRKMAVFNDVEPTQKLVLYPHRVDWVDRVPVVRKAEGEVVPLPSGEPLRLECEHFLECIQEGHRPRTDGESALRVLQVMEACEQSLSDGGRQIEVAKQAPSYFAHPTAIIDQPCQIGEGTKIWHFSHVMANSKLGKNCNLGQNVVISPDVEVGTNVKIQNNVSVYTGVQLEDDVFCGPSMVFTNVINPRSHVSRKNEYRKTVVRRGASLGANSTVVCGNTIGKYAFVAAGAVVTRDIPDYALVMGVPAKIAGWVCSCGTRISDSGQENSCAACGRLYIIEDQTCREVSRSLSAIP